MIDSMPMQVYSFDNFRREESTTSAAVVGMPFEDYHNARGLSKHMFDNFLVSPAHYKAAIDGSIVEDDEEKSDAFMMGSLIHTAVLEPAMYAKSRYVRPGGMDGRTKEGRSWIAEHDDLPCITEKSDAMITEMSRKVWSVPAASFVLGSGNAEVSMFWFGGKIPLKGRADLVTSDSSGRTLIVDYKTVKYGGADPDKFARDIAAYGYHIQAYWYINLAQRLGGINPVFMFIVQEKAPPYAVAMYALSNDWIGMAQETVEAGLAAYSRCRDESAWPGYPAETDVAVLAPPRWVHRHEEERVKMLLGMSDAPKLIATQAP